MTQYIAAAIDIDTRERVTIERLLHRHLPGVEVWAYGSRVRWNARPQSDLDLVVFASPEQRGAVSQLREAFQESSLPFSVDLLIWDDLPESFHRNIEAGYVVLQVNGIMGIGTVYGTFSSRFTESNLGNLCEKESGIQTGPFGSQLHQKDYVAEGTPIITVEHLGENRIVHQDLPRVSDYDRARLSKYALQTGDIVFSRVGSVDRRSLVRESEDGWLFSGRCLRVRPDHEKIDSGYLSYFLGLPAFREYIRSIAVGATMPSLNTSLLSDVTIYYPPLPEQRAIAHILGTLDDKIELNRRMNQTLEEMARAMFQDWFVDFGPVRAKLEGREPYLPPELWDLFPDRLVDSELGEMPEGWEIKALGDCIDVARGLSYKGSGLSSDGMPMHSLNSIYEGGGYKDDGIKFYSGDFQERHVTQPGDVIVANTEQGHDRLLIGFAAIVPRRLGDSGLFSHHIYRARPKSSCSLSSDFVCQLLNTKAMHDTISGYATGTTVNMLPVDALVIPPVVVPPIQLVNAFSMVSDVTRMRQEFLVTESRHLATQRDALLPKLLSGELQLEQLK